jgi:NTF2-related export protein 1/2
MTYNPLTVTPSQVVDMTWACQICADWQKGTTPPSLLLTVSGNVTHGKGPAGNPHKLPPKTVDGHPRVFSQTFMLVADPEASTTAVGEVAKYYISADALRFVG